MPVSGWLWFVNDGRKFKVRVLIFCQKNYGVTVKKIKEGFAPSQAYTKLMVAAAVSGVPRFVVTVAVFTKSA